MQSSMHTNDGRGIDAHVSAFAEDRSWPEPQSFAVLEHAIFVKAAYVPDDLLATANHFSIESRLFTNIFFGKAFQERTGGRGDGREHGYPNFRHGPRTVPYDLIQLHVLSTLNGQTAATKQTLT